MSTGNALAPIHDAHLVELTGVHPVTVRRWKKLARLPRWLERLVRVCLQGELGEIDRTWSGWRIVRGELVSPENLTYTPGAVRASTLWRSRALELGALDRKHRIARDADPTNGAHLERLARTHRAIEEARKAFDDLTWSLSAIERNQVYCSVAPAPAAPPGGRVIGADRRIGPRPILELIETRVGAGGLRVELLESLAEGRPGDAPGERAADERENDALAQCHGAPCSASGA